MAIYSKKIVQIVTWTIKEHPDEDRKVIKKLFGIPISKYEVIVTNLENPNSSSLGFKK
jgi:hypothetical protein